MANGIIVAGALRKKLIDAKISHETIQVQLHGDYKGIYSMKNGMISTNGYHEAIKVEDTVFDNLNPKGIDYKQWVDDLGISDPLYENDFKITTTKCP